MLTKDNMAKKKKKQLKCFINLKYRFIPSPNSV